MKVTWRTVVTALAVWFIFTVSSALSGLQVIGCLVIGRPRAAARILHAMDCLGAAQIGYSGRDTISKECGRQHDKTTFCRRICRWLDWGDEGHCEREGRE